MIRVNWLGYRQNTYWIFIWIWASLSNNDAVNCEIWWRLWIIIRYDFYSHLYSFGILEFVFFCASGFLLHPSSLPQVKPVLASFFFLNILVSRSFGSVVLFQFKISLLLSFKSQKKKTENTSSFSRWIESFWTFFSFHVMWNMWLTYAIRARTINFFFFFCFLISSFISWRKKKSTTFLNLKFKSHYNSKAPWNTHAR